MILCIVAWQVLLLIIMILVIWKAILVIVVIGVFIQIGIRSIVIIIAVYLSRLILLLLFLFLMMGFDDNLMIIFISLKRFYCDHQSFRSLSSLLFNLPIKLKLIYVAIAVHEEHFEFKTQTFIVWLLIILKVFYVF